MFFHIIFKIDFVAFSLISVPPFVILTLYNTDPSKCPYKIAPIGLVLNHLIAVYPELWSMAILMGSSNKYNYSNDHVNNQAIKFIAIHFILLISLILFLRFLRFYLFYFLRPMLVVSFC